MQPTNRLVPLLAALALLVGPLAGISVQAEGPPPAPPAFYGNLEVDGEPAPANVAVVAQINGEQRGCLNTGEPGSYGGASGFDDKLVVRGNGSEGKQVTFLVDGTEALPEEEVAWTAGEVREVNLSVDELGDDPLCARTSVTDDEVTIETENVQSGSTVAAEVPVPEATKQTGTGLAYLNVTAAEDIDELELEVRQTPEEPEDVEPPTLEGARSPLAYVDIETNVPDEVIEDATFSFHVDPGRLAEQDLSPSEVFLHHNDGTGWEVLPATHQGSNAEGHLFEATSPGFSVFAIGGPAPDADEDPDTSDGTDGDEAPDDTSGDETPDDGSDDADGTDDSEEAPQSGGSGGGPAGTGDDESSETEPTDQRTAEVASLEGAAFEVRADELPADATLVAEVPEPEADVPVRVDRLSFVAAEDLGDVQLRLDHASGLPEDGPPWLDPSPGEPLGVFEVTEHPPVDAIASAELVYEVPNDRVDRADLDTDNLTLYRHDGNGWTAHPTEIVADTGEVTEYRTRVPAFSVFALAPSPSAQIEITGRELLDETLLVGLDAEVLVTLENRGLLEGTRQVQLSADGEVVDEAQVTVPAGEVREVTLVWTPGGPGQTELSVDGEAFANPDVSEDESLEEAQVPEDEPSERQGEQTGKAWPWIAVAAFGGLLLVAAFILSRYGER